jgi:hypothetical protein
MRLADYTVGHSGSDPRAGRWALGQAGPTVGAPGALGGQVGFETRRSAGRDAAGACSPRGAVERRLARFLVRQAARRSRVRFRASLSMGGTLAVALAAAALPPAPSAPVLRHVRSETAAVRALVNDGYARAATFREIVDEVEARPFIVHIEPGRLSRRVDAALLHTVADAAREVQRRVLAELRTR